MLHVWPVMALIGLQFPQTPQTMLRGFIHKPEVWGTGGGLMAGIQTFQVTNVRGLVSLHRESMVQFDILGQSVRLIGRSLDRATILITAPDDDSPHTTIHATVNNISKSGSMLVLNIRSTHEFDRELLMAALQAGLLTCMQDDETMKPHPMLKLYRERLRILSSQ